MRKATEREKQDKSRQSGDFKGKGGVYLILFDTLHEIL